MKKIVIAIDGYSSTGKSTLAKQLANKLDYVYVDTGAMYRAVALFALRKGMIVHGRIENEQLINALSGMELYLKFNPQLGFSEVYLNGENVEKEIRGMEVSNVVSKVAAIPEIRRVLVKQQQKLGEQKGVVMDGRDIGTVVFPDAELKIFMTASVGVRAERRYKELRGKGAEVTLEEVTENVKGRDLIDTTREDSPLRKAEDAVVIDNSELTRAQQLQTVLGLAERCMR